MSDRLGHRSPPRRSGFKRTDGSSTSQARPAAKRRPPPPAAFYSSYRSKPLPLAFGPVQDSGSFQEADLRSKLLHNLPHSAGQIAAEATARAAAGTRSSSYPTQDSNVRLARQVHGAAAKRGFLADHRNLPVAETDATVRNRHLPPLDTSRLDQVHLNYLDRYNNRFATHPLFESRCTFCGSRHCSKYTAGSVLPNCTRFRQQMSLSATRAICNYRRCHQTTEHHTQVCPALHQRCPRCFCRGHGPGDGCNLSNGELMDRLRADFEAAADEGAYTRERRTQLSWGWYPYPQGAPIDFAPTSYDDLTEMDVLSALTYLRNLLKQRENVGHYPHDAAGPPSEPDRDEKDPPPPPPPPGPVGVVPVFL